MGPHGMCGEHRDLDMERGREKGEGSGREAEQWSKVCSSTFLSALPCVTSPTSAAGGDKMLEHGSAGPSQEGRVQSLGWLRARLTVAAIYSWGR